MLPAMVYRYSMGWNEMLLIDVPLFIAATLSVVNFYLVSQREAYPQAWRSRVKYLPIVLAVGIGLAVNNTRAVFEGLFGAPGEFRRTPKYGIGQSGDTPGRRYAQTMAVQPLIELAFGLYFTASVIYALSNGIYGTLPFLVLFQFGFLYTGVMSLLQQLGSDDLIVKAPHTAGGKH
jgi:hypothetical protein